MANESPSLGSLAKIISQTAVDLEAKLEQDGFPAPSFTEDGLADYPKIPDLIGLRMTLLDAIADLQRLALGPADTSIMGPFFLNYDAAILDVLNQFDFWSAVPLGGSATYSEIAKRVNLPETLVRRILKYAITTRFFASKPNAPESIVHTSLSAAPARNALLQSWLHHNLQEARPGSVHLAESFRKFSSGQEHASEEPLESGFAVANVDRLDEPESFWDYLRRDVEGKPKGWRATEFSNSMKAASSASAIQIEDLLKMGYNWAQLGDVTLVDIGGSGGHDAVCITEAFSNVKKVIVQDLPEVESSFKERVPDHLRSRISFEAHNFFDQQHTKGDVYMLKLILHDWPDKYATKILANIIPQLESGARLLLVENIAPPDKAQLPFVCLARLMAAADLQMLNAFNSLERSIEAWRTLLGKVDKRLEITFISDIPGSLHNFLEVKLRG